MRTYRTDSKSTVSSHTLLLACFCIALLFEMTTLQASHLCGNQTSGGTTSEVSGVQHQASTSNNTVCVLCLMAQTAAAIFLMIVFAPAVRRGVRARAAETAPGIPFTSFQLYVRPPPIY